jgi:hypothetical protein
MTPVIFVTALIAVYAFYSQIRPRPQIATMASACAKFIAISAVMCTLTYMVAPHRQLVDDQLAAADKFIGFDWLAFFNWVKSHPNIDLAFECAYSSMLPQMLITIIVLGATKRFDQLNEFVAVYFITLFITTVCFVFFPAAGAWETYGVANNPTLIDSYLPDFHMVRDTQMQIFDLSKAHGIIQFPSFHAALALIFIIAARGVRFLFQISIALNCVMIVSALTHGGHHLADIVAGLALTSAVVVSYVRIKLASRFFNPPTI